MHFGYIKVYTKSPIISEFEVIMGYIPFTTRYSPLDWKTLINTIIQKKGKGDYIKNLCTLNQIEADFNFNNKVIARMIMECAEFNKCIPKE